MTLDRLILQAILEMPDYVPLLPIYSLAAMQEAEATLTRAEQNLQRARRALDQARAEMTVASITFHELVTGAKGTVVIQYGNDSTAVKAVGLTRKSERKRPARRRKDPQA